MKKKKNDPTYIIVPKTIKYLEINVNKKMKDTH